MAKLSARGSKPLARAFVETYYTTEQDDLVSYRKNESLLRSDGKLLTRSVVVFRSDTRRHDYGWTLKGAVKPQYADPTAWRKLYEAKGWTLTNV